MNRPSHTCLTAFLIMGFVCCLNLSAFADTIIKSKSNVKNNRVMPDGFTEVVDSNIADACDTNGSEIVYLQNTNATARDIAARSSTKSSSFSAMCALAQSAIAKMNADDAKRLALQTAVEANDTNALRQLFNDNGLTDKLMPNAQFHAINTKGTGGNRSQVGGITGGVVAGIAVAKTTANEDSVPASPASADKITISVGVVEKNKNGHVTLNR
jgi:hypothetical protein